MATNVIETYTKHCQDVEEAYKRLHQQHLTVFGAFQRLQQAATGLRKSTEHINKALDSSVADEELGRMLDEQETIMNKLRLMERENAGLVGEEGSDPMYNGFDFTSSASSQAGGGGSNDETTPTHHPRQSLHPPYDGYHDSHIAPYKKARGGARVLNDKYFDYVKTIANAAKPFTSFYGYTNALVDIPCPHESFAQAAKHNPTLNYPFRRMLSEIVGNVRWCDYVFHHRIPGMFTMTELETLSALKADAYNPCLKVKVTDGAEAEEAEWQKLFEADYKQHNHRTRVVFPGVSPQVQYFLPAFERVGDTLTLLFHVARGSRAELPQIEMTGDVKYQVYVQKMHTNTGKIPKAKAADLRTRSSIRNTFRKYAFFHESTVSDNTDTDTIIAECITEFKAQNKEIADTWEKGYGQLRKAVTAGASKEHVQKLLSAMQST